MLSGLLAALAQIFSAQLASIASALTGTFSLVVTELPADEQKILHDAMASALADAQGGKPIDAILSDAWNTFYAEERGEASKIGRQLLGAFVTSLTPTS